MDRLCQWFLVGPADYRPRVPPIAAQIDGAAATADDGAAIVVSLVPLVPLPRNKQRAKLYGWAMNRVPAETRRDYDFALLPQHVIADAKHGGARLSVSWLMGPCRFRLDTVPPGEVGLFLFTHPDQRMTLEWVDIGGDAPVRGWLVVERIRAGGIGPADAYAWGEIVTRDTILRERN